MQSQVERSCGNNMSDKPKVSVIILTYNHERYIEDCLNGMLRLNYDNIELIISDDASTDQTFQKIQALLPGLEKKFSGSGLTVIQNPSNQGLIKNAISAMNLAKGEYIKPLSGDDIILENYLSVMVDYMEGNRSCALAYCNSYIVPAQYKFGDAYRQYPEFFKNQNTEILPSDFFEKILFQEITINSPASLYRAAKYFEYGGYDPDIQVEDFNMWLTIARSEKIGYVDQTLILYRKADNSMTDHKRNDGSKLLFLYQEGLKAYTKHVPYLSDNEKRKRAWEIFFHYYLFNAVKLGYKKETAIIYEEAKKISNLPLKTKWIVLLSHTGMIELYRFFKRCGLKK